LPLAGKQEGGFASITGASRTTPSTGLNEEFSTPMNPLSPQSATLNPEIAGSTKSEFRPEEWTNRRATEQAQRAANARQVSGRRRFVDPTTCEREYSTQELEFMHAMHDYKKSSGRMFPTWSEVLEVIRALGYEKSNELAV
jgi:hypothetical protein